VPNVSVEVVMKAAGLVERPGRKRMKPGEDKRWRVSLGSSGVGYRWI
jgi:hypothetical protein